MEAVSKVPQKWGSKKTIEEYRREWYNNTFPPKWRTQPIYSTMIQFLWHTIQCGGCGDYMVSRLTLDEDDTTECIMMPNRKMIMNKDTKECWMRTQNLIRTLMYIFNGVSGKPIITKLLKEQMTPKENGDIDTLYEGLNLNVFGPEFAEAYSYIAAGTDKFNIRRTCPMRIKKLIDDGGHLFYCQKQEEDEECKLKHLNGITGEFRMMIEQQRQKRNKRRFGRVNCSEELACNLTKLT